MLTDLTQQPSRKKSVIVQVGLGYFSQIIAMVQGLFLIPLYLSYLGVTMYGLWLASGGVLAWLGFAELGLGTVAMQRMSDSYGKKNYSAVSEYFSSALIIFIVVGLVVLFAGYALSLPLPLWIGATAENEEIIRGCFQLAVLATAIKIINECLKGLAVSLLRPLVPSVALVFWQLVGLAIIVSMILLGYGLWSLPVGFLVTQSGNLLVNLVYSHILLYKSNGGFWMSKPTKLKELFAISPYVFVGRLGNSLARNIEPTLIAMVLSPEVTTAFTVMRRAADLVFQMINVVLGSSFAGVAHVFASGNKEKAASVCKMVLQTGFFTSLFGYGIYLTSNQSFVGLWVGQEYFISQVLVAAIAISLFFRTIQNFLIDQNMASGDLKRTSVLVFLETITRIGLIYILLKMVGVIGAPIGLMISCALFGLIQAKNLSDRTGIAIFNIRSWLANSFIVTVVYGLAYFGQTYFGFADSWLVFIGQLIISFVAIGMLLIIYPYSRRSMMELAKEILPSLKK